MIRSFNDINELYEYLNKNYDDIIDNIEQLLNIY